MQLGVKENMVTCVAQHICSTSSFVIQCNVHFAVKNQTLVCSVDIGIRPNLCEVMTDHSFISVFSEIINTTPEVRPLFSYHSHCSVC